ncbi:MAG: ribosome small subunit-dependent GTPase A [Labilithrix sp.]|nr:ribosome small subunit-dependent GTPase A [Labilithrix sp.]
MHFHVSESLICMGWSEDLARRCQEIWTERTPPPGAAPARVVRQDRGSLVARTADGLVAAHLAGRLSHEAIGPLDLPTIGDWIVVSATNPAIVHAVVPRTSLLARRAAGGTAKVQPLAANVDVALVVQPLDRAVNLRRIERTLTLVRDAGVTPVVVLTKADVALEPTAAKRAAGVIAGASVFALGLQDPLGALSRECLAPARTAIMLGPSGAGKSTLANRLLGEDRLTVGDVRRRDAKGRHTTTHRELVVLENGALLIDGPGIRELGLWADEGAVADTFEEIHRLAQGCRFRDCEHHGEPGCAVREALARGELDAGRLGSFQKLARESEYEASRTDAALRLERQRSARALSRAARAAVRRKRG